MKTSSTRLAFTFFLMACSSGHGADQFHPLAAATPNLVTGATFEESGTWLLSTGTSYSRSVSKESGTGSIKFSVDDPNAKSAWYAQIQSNRIENFKYLTPYTISAQVKSEFIPTYLEAFIRTWDKNGKIIPHHTVTTTTGMASTSISGKWQEVRFSVSINSTDVKQIAICIGRSMNDWGLKDFYVDNVNFSAGIAQSKTISQRRKFEGSSVRIDDQGNWSIIENGNWKPFFPFGLYPYLERKDYQSLSRQGFNLVLSQQYRGQVALAKAAVSNFNPYGMKSGLRLARYATPGDKYWSLSRLQAEMQAILVPQPGQANLNETLIMYDWDNEKNWKTWHHWSQMVNVIRSNDRSRPIYILNGYPGVQPVFDKLSDVSGTYVGLDPKEGYESGFAAFEIFRYSENQLTPASIAQLNDIADKPYGLRERIYNAITKDAKGIVVWGDGIQSEDNKGLKFVESRTWWADVPNLRREIDLLLPVLQQPSSSQFQLASNDPEIRYDIKQLQGRFILILLNPGSNSKSVAFSSSSHRIDEISHFFDDATLNHPRNSDFNLELAAHSTAVYRLAATESAQNNPAAAPMPPTFNSLP